MSERAGQAEHPGLESPPDVPEEDTAPAKERAFEPVLDNVPGAWFFIRRDGTFAYVNEGACKGLGYTREELLACNIFDIDANVTAEQWDMLWAITPPNDARALRVQHRRKDGTLVPVEVRASRLWLEGEDVTVCYTVDLSEQLRLEEQLARAQKVEAVGQLARGVAHDFNNLLQVIQGQAHLIAVEPSGAQFAPMLSEIEEAVGRASALIRQLLAFSRTGTVDMSPVRLDGLVEGLHKMLNRLLGEHIGFEWHCTEEPLWVHGNAPQLEQVVANLCINARDAMPRGGRLQMRLSTSMPEDVPMALRDREAVGLAVLCITDEGEGMSEAVQARLFEPFFTTKRPGIGTGLGLPTVQAIVQAHGGAIEVRSSLGRGTTFRVFLPTIEPNAKPAVATSTTTHVYGRGRVALVAEDEPAVRDLTVRYLEQAGFRVLVACDGVEAEQILNRMEVPPAVAVLDAVMPRLSGKAVFRAIRDRGWPVPVLFVTGYDYESLAGVAQEPEVAILQKPFSEAGLLTQLSQVLRDD